MTTARGPLPTVRRHPFMGLVGGFLVGLAIALFAVLYGVVAVGTIPPLAIVAALTVGGLLWGWRGPIRVRSAMPDAATPEFNERIQHALADNEAAIEEARHPKQVRPEDLPDIRPAAADDETDWHGGRPDE